MILDQKDKERKRINEGRPVYKPREAGQGLGSEIDRYNRDIRGKIIKRIPPDEDGNRKLYRLRKWQGKIKGTKNDASLDRNLSIARPKLDSICGNLKIAESHKQECLKLYIDAVKKGLIKGHSIEAAVAAIIRVISRKYELPITLKELAEASGRKKKQIEKARKKICGKLEIKMARDSAIKLLPKWAQKLETFGLIEKAEEIIKKAEKKGIASGKKPLTIALAALIMADKLTDTNQLTVKTAALKGGITEKTISKGCDTLKTIMERREKKKIKAYMRADKRKYKYNKKAKNVELRE